MVLESRTLSALAAFSLALALALPAPSSAAPPDSDAITAARFSITIDGVQVASFSELSALTSNVQLALAPEGGAGAGRSSADGSVVLARPQTRGLELWSWHEAALAGDIAGRKQAVLLAHGSDGAPVARYHLANAWPSKIEIGSLRSGSSQVLMETVTITCERVQRVSP